MPSAVINARDPAWAGGVIADGVSDDTAAINAVLAAAAVNGGTVLWPAGRIKTQGGHIIPVGVNARGVRRGISGDGTANGTSFRHRGSSYCFKLTDETSGGAGCGLYDVSIYGSSATDAAVAGASGVEIGNGQRCNLESTWITGFTGAGSVGLRFHNTTGTVLYCEHHHVRNVNVGNCSKCVVFLADGGGSGTSFGYNNLLDVSVQIYAGQTGYEVSGGTLYNSRIIGQMHYTGNNGIGFNVTASGLVWQGTYIDIVGEMLAAWTGCTRLNLSAQFAAVGRFFIANGQPPDTSQADFHEFDLDGAAVLTRDIASAATISVPGGSDFWNVTGTTNITTISGSWEGRTVTLKFAGILTVTDGSNLKLAGNFVTTADDTITLIHRSGIWYEVARSVN